MKVSTALLIGVTILHPSTGLADKCPFGSFASEFLQAQSRTKTAVVYAECRQKWGKSVLVLLVSPFEWSVQNGCESGDRTIEHSPRVEC